MSPRLLFVGVAFAGSVLIVAACSSFGEAEAQDAGADAAPAPAIDASSFCQTQPDAAFCADFEDGRPLTYAFQPIGPVSIADAGNGSLLRAMAEPDAEAAALHVLTTTLPNGVSLAFRMQMTTLTPPDDAAARGPITARLSFGEDTASRCRVSLAMSSSKGTFRMQRDMNATVELPTSIFPGAGPAWFDVRIDLTVSDANVLARVRFDGKDALAGGPTLLTPCAPTQLMSTPSILLGGEDGDGQFEVSFDDIVVYPAQ